MVGGANVVTGANLAAGANAAIPWPQVSAEKMIALDPQIIIFAKMQGAGVDTAQIIAGMRNDAAWKSVAAIKSSRIYAVDDDLVTIPGPRLVDGTEKVVGVICGKARAAE
jgi:iron complex transport system substrate-binding protein